MFHLECEVVGFLCGLYEFCCLLGCYTAWVHTDVSGLRICPILIGQDDQEYVVPKRRYETNLRCVTSQKTRELFSFRTFQFLECGRTTALRSTEHSTLSC